MLCRNRRLTLHRRTKRATNDPDHLFDGCVDAMVCIDKVEVLVRAKSSADVKILSSYLVLGQLWFAGKDRRRITVWADYKVRFGAEGYERPWDESRDAFVSPLVHEIMIRTGKDESALLSTRRLHQEMAKKMINSIPNSDDRRLQRSQWRYHSYQMSTLRRFALPVFAP